MINLLFLCASIVIASVSWAEPKAKDPVYLSAQTTVYDNATETFKASGDVVVSDGVETVQCDRLSYNKKTTLLIAEGNVRYFTKTKDIITTSYLELTDTFKYALIAEFGLLMADESRLTGTGAEKFNEITFIDGGTFTPCYLCEEDPTAPPVWALRASTVKHNKPKQIIEYYNAHMEFLGVPVFYTPYFYHSDPSVKRQSGFLFPTISRSNRYGLAVGLPYFWAISPSEDLTLTPYPMLEGGTGSFLRIEHRKHFGFGETKTHASIGYTRNRDRKKFDREKNKKQLMGHLFSKGEFTINELWRLRYTLQKMDSQTYLKRYVFLDDPAKPITTATTLDSSFHFERFNGNDYADISGHWFQDLRETEPRKQTPAIIPSLYYQHVSDPGELGEVWQFSVANIFLTRPESAPGYMAKDIYVPAKVRELNRFVAEGQFYIPYTTPDGSLWSLTTRLNARLYSFYGFKPTRTSANRQGSEGDIFPQLTLGWSKPYYQFFDSQNQVVIDPIVNFVTSPRGYSKASLPNEDSLNFEFSENNLFVSDRFSGLDRLDEGTRLNYGVKTYYNHRNRTVARLFLGQSYSFNRYDFVQNAAKKGLYKKLSDYLATVYLSPLADYSVTTSLLLDRGNFQPKLLSVRADAGPPIFKVTASYTFIKDRLPNQQNKPRTHQVNVGVSSLIDKEWKISSSMGYDLKKPKKLLYINLDLDYHNECFGVITSIKRTFFRSATLRPQTLFLLTFSFKHLGTFGSQFVADRPVAAKR